MTRSKRSGARAPIMQAQKIAAPAVAAMLVGMKVRDARARVEQESEQRDIPLWIEFRTIRGPEFAVYKYGRIRAFVQDGVVTAASAG